MAYRQPSMQANTQFPGFIRQVWRSDLDNTQIYMVDFIRLMEKNSCCGVSQSTSMMNGKDFLRTDLVKYAAASNLQFNEHIKSLQNNGVKIHHLGFGQSPFPVPEFAEKALKKYAHVGQYLPIRGLPELRELICSMHSKEDDLHHFKASEVIVGPGSKELIFLLFSVTDCDVLLLAPTWTTYMPQAILARHRVIKVPTDIENNWKLTPSVLDMVCKQHHVKPNSILILCNPDNPTGTVYNEKEFEELSLEFREHRILVLSDEIYSRLSFDKNHVSIAKYYPEGTILSCGISKWASCGGWRLGYHMYPDNLKALGGAVASAASQTFTSASAPIQYASVELLKFGDESKMYVSHCSRILKAVSDYCCSELRQAGVKVSTPYSGYYIFPDFEVLRHALNARGIFTGGEMCAAVLDEAGVAIMAGGPAYLHSENDLTVRLCYVNFNGKVALEASRDLGLDRTLPENFVQDFCSPTVEAIDSIVSWMTKLINKKEEK